MKKTYRTLPILIVLLSSINVYSQRIELVPMVGNIFQSTYYGYEGRIVFGSGIAYGAMLNVLPNKYVEVGLNIINQESEARFISNYPLLQSDETVSAGLINYQLSFVRNFVQSDVSKVIPFAGMDIGAIQVYQKNASTPDYVRMSIGFKAGLKVQFSERINLRIQPQLEMPLQFAGIGIGIGTGGASVGATTYASFVQFGIMGGLGFSLK